MIVGTLLLPAVSPAGEDSLWPLLEKLRAQRFVDLTHGFRPGIPHWPGFDDERRTLLYHYEPGVGARGHGFLAHEYCHVGQWGTHVDPPIHFVPGKRALDEIPVTEMLLPLVIFDVSGKVAADPDYQVRMEDVRDWETRHGPVPEGAFVALRTDWSKRWPDQAAMLNRDAQGIAHYPGWSLEVLRYLYEKRRITASGHETTDTDPGIATSRGDYSLERYILGQDRYQVELLANLDQVPEAGAIAVVSFPKPEAGSGFPARVIAIVP
jgi:kynurenine formamidase